MRIKILFLLLPMTLFAFDGRFFYEGDGTVHLSNRKTGKEKRVTYRLPDGTYAEKEVDRLSLRLIALLDHLEDRLGAKRVVLLSGYRTTEANQRLRQKGALAASASLHLDGMAADVELEGVPAKSAWDYLRGLQCCGAGYYHGGSLHVDTGPSRFWDEKTSGVEKGPAPPNKLVIIRTDRDIYLPGETVSLTLARVTAYPFAVAGEMRLFHAGKETKTFPLDGDGSPCRSVTSKSEQSWQWTIPRDFSSDQKVSVRLRFCPNDFSEMPREVDSNQFLIIKREE